MVYAIKLWKIDGNIIISQNSTVRVNETNSDSPDRIHLGLGRFSTYGFGKVRFYAFKVRAYADPEPSQGSWTKDTVLDFDQKTTYNYNTGLSGWSYKKSHVINNATGAGSNYQIKIVVHNGSGTDSGENMYLGNKSLNWPNDIRFTDDDGTTLLDYWMETSNSNNATFWVEIQDNLSSSNATIYVYYDKANVASESSGDNTFLFFDDFSESSLDTNKWSLQSGSATVSGGTLNVSSTANYGGIRTVDTFSLTDSRMLEFKARFSSDSEMQNGVGFFDTSGATT